MVRRPATAIVVVAAGDNMKALWWQNLKVGDTYTQSLNGVVISTFVWNGTKWIYVEEGEKK